MMTRMTVATQGYLLAEDTDVGALQVEVCDAIRRGSGIVTVDRSSGPPVTIVVSPGVLVSFETLDQVEESGSPVEADASVEDWETYL